jgi:hypothetical protein
VRRTDADEQPARCGGLGAVIERRHRGGVVDVGRDDRRTNHGALGRIEQRGQSVEPVELTAGDP